MKLYQVGVSDRHNGNEGYEYVTSRKEVARIEREAKAAEKSVAVYKHTIKLTKAGVLLYLNAHCGHPDNG